MPSWTFVASAGAVQAAGLTPHFVDVCPDTWVPDPVAVRALAEQLDVGAVLVVSPFGAPLDLGSWDAVKRETGIPIIVDGAAAFDTLRHDGPMQAGECPIAVSLHATKVFGVGEGGAVICRDDDTMRRIRALSQFGFSGSRDASVMGINAKLSEYAAAVGLAGFDEWPDTRARWAAVARRYAAGLPRGIALTPDFGANWVTSTFSIVLPAPRPRLEAALNDVGISTLRWWGPGCHAQQAYAACPAEPLPVTERLARLTVGLPFWQDIDLARIDEVCAALGRLIGPQPIASRHRRQLARERAAQTEMVTLA